MSQHPWIASYPSGVRWDAALETCAVQDLLTRAAERFADLPALDFMGRQLSFAELDAMANRAAKGFQTLGVGPGVHVGLFLPNTPHYAIAFFGALRAGATIVNYSPLDAAKTLAHKVEDSETDVMVTLNLAALFPQMQALLGTSRLKHLVVGDFEEFTGHPAGVRAHLAAAKMLADMPPDLRRSTFAHLLDNDGAYRSHPVGDVDHAVAVLQYTGGTTGAPKGAMLTHANLTAAVSQCVETTRSDPPTMNEGEDRVLEVLPAFHIYALVVVMLLCVRMGASQALHARFDAEAVLKDIEEKKITRFPGVPTMFVALLMHPKAATTDFRSLKWCNSGGAPMPVEVMKGFEALTDKRVTEGWGMTETCALGTFTPVTDIRKPGSCGVPQVNVEMKFLSVEDGKSYVPFGQRGEICIRGPNVMKGYWKNPEATAAITTADGFMRTGDVGYIDEQGYVYIVDRTKDMILCGGYNVYPRNIEEAIYQHPAVEAVTVIGVPDPYRGQSPKAFIKLKAGSAPPTFEEMRAFLRDKLGKHEMISAIDIRAELPRTAVGKLSKKELYEEEARKQG